MVLVGGFESIIEINVEQITVSKEIWKNGTDPRS